MSKTFEKKMEDPAYAYKVEYNKLPSWRRNKALKLLSFIVYLLVSFGYFYLIYKLLGVSGIILAWVPLLGGTYLDKLFPASKYKNAGRANP